MLYINDHIWDFDLAASLALLSPQRREQALRYRFEQGQRTSVAAYLLLCQGLREEYGIGERPVFEYGEHGKPFIVGHPEIYFNMSHCCEAVVCALSDHPVGVDVESVRKLSESLVRYTMNEHEVRQILSAEQPALEFTRVWTRKEAVVKWSGRGIGDDMKEVLALVPAPLTTVVAPDGRYVYSVCGVLK